MRKFFVRAAAAASVFAMAPAAYAAITVTTPTSVSSSEVNPSLTSISFRESQVAVGTGILETLSFTSTEASRLIFTLGTGFTGIDFTDVFVTQGETRVFTLANIGDPNPEQLAGNFIAGAGTFTLNILSNNAGPVGTFAGTVTASAVPEPTTWAMMLIGFGAVGYSMRRRKVGYAGIRAQAI